MEEFLGIPGIGGIFVVPVRRQKEHEDGIEDVLMDVCIACLKLKGKSGNMTLFTPSTRMGLLPTEETRLRQCGLFLSVILGLPPRLRQKHMFLAAVWVDQVEPKMNPF